MVIGAGLIGLPEKPYLLMTHGSIGRSCQRTPLMQPANNGGCSAADDRRLARKATIIGIVNPVLAPVARAVALGMWTASLTRSR